MSTIKINIVSSSEEIYSGEATMVYATGSLGELGIAPGHTPLLTGLAPGPVRVENGSEEEAFFVLGAFLKFSLILSLSCQILQKELIILTNQKQLKQKKRLNKI